MALKIEPDNALRGHSDLQSLVHAIYEADPTDESDAIEWKSTLDLLSNEGSFAVSRTILGLRNRTVANARRSFEGVGYIAIGVEPGNLIGAAAVDGQVLDPKIAQWCGTGDGPAWSHHNVVFNNVNVVVFVVEAPRSGDPLYPLRKSHQPPNNKPLVPRGTIFTRRNGKTDRADDTEVLALSARASDTGPAQIDVDVVLAIDGSDTQPLRIPSIDTGKATTDWLTERERGRLTVPATNRPQSMLGLPQISTAPSTAEIDAYLSEYRDQAGPWFEARVAGMLLDDYPLSVSIRNNTDLALRDVRVVATLPAGVAAHFFKPTVNLPKRPQPKSQFMTTTFDYDLPSIEPFSLNESIERLGNRTVITWRIRILHAHSTEALETLAVFDTGGAGRNFTMDFVVTASDRRGEKAISVAVEGSPTALGAAQMFGASSEGDASATEA